MTPTVDATGSARTGTAKEMTDAKTLTHSKLAVLVRVRAFRGLDWDRDLRTLKQTLALSRCLGFPTGRAGARTPPLHTSLVHCAVTHVRTDATKSP